MMNWDNTYGHTEDSTGGPTKNQSALDPADMGDGGDVRTRAAYLFAYTPA